MDRRTMIQILSSAAIAGQPVFGAHEGHCGTGGKPEAYTLRFFSAEEHKALDQVMEMILPADDHSPGAHAAKVADLADFLLSSSDASLQQFWRKGMKLFMAEAERTSLEKALERAADGEDKKERSELEQFFVRLKRMTIDGYYTSEIGIHQDLRYQGNAYVPNYAGCTHPEHQK